MICSELNGAVPQVVVINDLLEFGIQGLGNLLEGSEAGLVQFVVLHALFNHEVNVSLIGGIVIQIGDRVVDGSIRTQLGNMAKELSKIQLVK